MNEEEQNRDDGPLDSRIETKPVFLRVSVKYKSSGVFKTFSIRFNIEERKSDVEIGVKLGISNVVTEVARWKSLRSTDMRDTLR